MPAVSTMKRPRLKAIASRIGSVAGKVTATPDGAEAALAVNIRRADVAVIVSGPACGVVHERNSVTVRLGPSQASVSTGAPAGP